VEERVFDCQCIDCIELVAACRAAARSWRTKLEAQEHSPNRARMLSNASRPGDEIQRRHLADVGKKDASGKEDTLYARACVCVCV